jgi:NDP-sugar pyrophosphorylase family protein
MKALILAGGEGRRLRPLTNDKPKPLLDVGGKPIIEWQIEWMKKYDIKEFVISGGYMKEKLIESLGTGAKFGVEISFVFEDEPLGTGGGIKNVESAMKGEDLFVVVNGDIITNLDLGNLVSSHSGIATISLTPLTSPYGIVETVANKVVGFREKPTIKDHWLNAGVYVMSSGVFEHLPNIGSVENITFPSLARLGLLYCVKYDHVYWRSIDNFKDFEEANTDLTNGVVFK